MYQNNSMGRDAHNFNMPRTRVAHAANNLCGDIPPEELTNRNTPPRRRCDGSLARGEAVSGFDNTTDCGCVSGDSCGIACTGWGLNNYPVAMVYSPCQPWTNVYKPEVALERGTIFKDLDLPFEGGTRRGGCC